MPIELFTCTGRFGSVSGRHAWPNPIAASRAPGAVISRIENHRTVQQSSVFLEITGLKGISASQTNPGGDVQTTILRLMNDVLRPHVSLLEIFPLKSIYLSRYIYVCTDVPNHRR